jgi:hypothetical protein
MCKFQDGARFAPADSRRPFRLGEAGHRPAHGDSFESFRRQGGLSVDLKMASKDYQRLAARVSGHDFRVGVLNLSVNSFHIAP